MQNDHETRGCSGTDNSSARLLEPGSFRFDPTTSQLWRGSEQVTLRPMAAALLALLSEKKGLLVSHDEILEHIWGPGTSISASAIKSLICDLRRSLGEDGQALIRSVPRRGYRLIAESNQIVTDGDGHDASQNERSEDHQGQPNDLEWLRISHRNVRSVSLLAVAGALVLLLAPLARQVISGPATGGPAVGKRPSLAVLSLQNLSSSADSDWLGTAIAEMLAAHLAVDERLVLVPGHRIEQMKIDLDLGPEERFGPQTVQSIRTHLHNDAAVVGSYLYLSDKSDGLRVDVRLLDSQTGSVIHASSLSGNLRNLVGLIERLGEDLLHELQVSPAPVGPTEAPLTLLYPTDPAAARLYSDGILRLRHADYLGAHDLLMAAAEIEPGHALTHMNLAEALMERGFELDAQKAATRAFELCSNLPRRAQLEIKATYHRCRFEHDEEAAVRKALFDFFPESFELGVRLVTAQLTAGQIDEAAATIEALRSLPPPFSYNPLIDHEESALELRRGNLGRSIELIRRAADGAERLGMRRLFADSKLDWASRALDLGNIDEGLELCEDGEAESRQIGYQRGIILALNIRATFFENTGKLRLAEEGWKEALAHARKIGDRGTAAVMLNNLTLVAYEQTNRSQVIALSLDAIEEHRAVSDPFNLAVGLKNLATVLRSAGHIERATEALDECVSIARQIGADDTAVAALSSRSFLLMEVGSSAAGLEAAEQAVLIARSMEDPRLLGLSLRALGLARLQIGHLDQAEQDLRRSIEISAAAHANHLAALGVQALSSLQHEMGLLDDAHEKLSGLLDARLSSEHHWDAMLLRTKLAGLALDRERLDEAQRYIRAAETDLDSIGGDPPARFLLIAAEVALAHDRLLEAERLITRAAQTELQGQSKLRWLEVQLVKARIAARSGRDDQAEAIVAEVIEGASTTGLVGLQLSARLAKAEIELTLGHENAGLRSLKALIEDAESKGYGRVTAKARQLLTSINEDPGAD